MNEKLIIIEKEKCGSRGNCNNFAEEPHTCPYSEEINGDSETLCECCSNCEHECAMDI
jgi:hypothetical protein